MYSSTLLLRISLSRVFALWLLLMFIKEKPPRSIQISTWFLLIALSIWVIFLAIGYKKEKEMRERTEDTVNLLVQYTELVEESCFTPMR